jgi:hypothetical protein
MMENVELICWNLEKLKRGRFVGLSDGRTVSKSGE